MTMFQAVVLGILQGLAEFLPISSSAHLALAPWLLGWPSPGLAFDVSLHVGTLAAVLWFFRDEWRSLLAATEKIVRTRRAESEIERRVVFLIIASVPGGVGGLLLNGYAETIFRAPGLIAVMLILMGVLLWAVDRFSPRVQTLATMNWRQALTLGVVQIAALVPGVSRSGATMTAGRALGFHRESAAVFSFLMSMPITAAAAVFKVPEAIRESGLNAPMAAGVIASGLSGWLAISVLLKYVAKHGLGIFAIYRFIVGIMVLIVVLLRG